MQIALQKEVYDGNDLEAFNPTTPEARRAKSSMMPFYKQEGMIDKTNKDFLQEFEQELPAKSEKKRPAQKHLKITVERL